MKKGEREAEACKGCKHLVMKERTGYCFHEKHGRSLVTGAQTSMLASPCFKIYCKGGWKEEA